MSTFTIRVSSKLVRHLPIEADRASPPQVDVHVACGLWAVDCGDVSRVKGGPVSLILEGRKVCLSVKNVRQTTYGAMWDEPSDRAVHRPARWAEVTGNGHRSPQAPFKVRMGLDMPH